MDDKSFYIMAAIVVILLTGFVFGMHVIRKNLQKGKSVVKAVVFPLLFGFILAIGMLILAFSYM